jgi:hypothetical protein
MVIVRCSSKIPSFVTDFKMIYIMKGWPGFCINILKTAHLDRRGRYPLSAHSCGSPQSCTCPRCPPPRTSHRPVLSRTGSVFPRSRDCSSSARGRIPSPDTPHPLSSHQNRHRRPCHRCRVAAPVRLLLSDFLVYQLM